MDLSTSAGLPAPEVAEQPQGEEGGRDGGQEQRSVLDAFSTLVAAQLDAVIGETEAAAFKLVEGLQALERGVLSLGGRLAHKAAESDAIFQRNRLLRDAKESIREYSEAVQSVKEQLQRNERSARHDRERYLEMLRAADTTKSRLDTIIAVTTQARILSVNAKLEAVRAGEHGRGFGVVATGVTELAQQSRHITEAVGQDISGLASTLERELVKLMEREEETSATLLRESQMLDELASALVNMSTAYSDLYGNHVGLLQELGETSTTVTRLAQDMLASIQFQDIVRQRLEQVSKMTGRFSNVISRALQGLGEAGAAVSAELFQELQRLAGEYVMAGQRRDHAEILGLAVGAEEDLPDVELF